MQHITRSPLDCSVEHLILKRYPYYLLLPIMLYIINEKLLSISILILLSIFFRSPPRSPKLFKIGTLYSPADGNIMSIRKVKGFNIVCIFLSIFDVHVQYAPANCQVVDQRYKPGEFNLAWILEKSDFNERLETDLLIEDTKEVVTLVQIAGQLAQRIDSFVKKGDKMRVGCKFGMIHFSSRVDIYIPDTYQLKVALGQNVIAAKSELAVK